MVVVRGMVGGVVGGVVGVGVGGYSANRSRYRTQENWNYAGRNGSNQFRDDLSYNKRHNDHQDDHPAANRDYYNRQRENR